MEWAKKKFGNAIISPALLTSVAAAFCDIDEYEKKAKKHCDRAFAMTNGKGAGELSSVYQRFKSKTK